MTLAADGELRRAGFDRILIVKPSSLGDLVHALPVLHGLRTRFPGAAIDWLVSNPFVPLLEGHPDLTEVIPFDRGRYARIGRSWPATASFLRLLRRLRNHRYDLVLDLQGLFRSGFLARATGAPVRLGLADAREGASLFYTHRTAPSGSETHAVDRLFGAARSLGFEDVPIRFELPLPDAARRFADDVFSSAGKERAFVVAPGARWETKRWPASRFAETIREVCQNSPAACILLGGQDERDLADRITREASVPLTNLVGRTGLVEFAALIRRADLVLCHDSAAAHLAACYDRPLVCLTGPTHPRRTGPYGRLQDVVLAGVSCSPCYLRRMRQCRYDHRCMSDVPVSRVVGEICRRLEERSVSLTANRGGRPAETLTDCR